MYNIACILMASGLSRRMEQNKLLLCFNQKKLFTYAVDALHESQIRQKIVVSAYDEILNYTNNIDGFKIIKNNKNHLGQSQSIILGVSNCTFCDGFMFLPCDMPFITSNLLDNICKFFYEDTSSIAVPIIQGKNSMPTIFPYKFKDDLLSLTGDIGGRDIIKNNIDTIRYFEVKNPLLLKDIDTKEDLKYLK